MKVDLRVVVSTDDERPDAPDRIEATVQRALALWFAADKLYIEQAVTR